MVNYSFISRPSPPHPESPMVMSGQEEFFHDVDPMARLENLKAVKLLILHQDPKGEFPYLKISRMESFRALKHSRV